VAFRRIQLRMHVNFTQSWVQNWCAASNGSMLEGGLALLMGATATPTPAPVEVAAMARWHRVILDLPYCTDQRGMAVQIDQRL
jgi:hypothetical protein